MLVIVPCRAICVRRADAGDASFRAAPLARGRPVFCRSGFSPTLLYAAFSRTLSSSSTLLLMRFAATCAACAQKIASSPSACSSTSYRHISTPCACSSCARCASMRCCCGVRGGVSAGTSGSSGTEGAPDALSCRPELAFDRSSTFQRARVLWFSTGSIVRENALPVNINSIDESQ